MLGNTPEVGVRWDLRTNIADVFPDVADVAWSRDTPCESLQ